MTTAVPAPNDVLEKIDALGPPGTPVTTPEVTEGFDCSQRTIYNKLESLVKEDDLETKKVGANSRVWWRPADTHDRDEYDPEATVTESTFRQLFENVPGLYLIVEPENYEIVAVSDAYLEATMTDREEIMGETLFDVFPAEPDDPDPEGAPRLRRSLDRVNAEQETDVMPVTFYPIPRPASETDEFEDRWWSPTNAPVVDESGEITYIIHRVEDVTPVVRQLQADGSEAVLDRLDTRDSHITTDIMLRGQELHEAKEAAHERLRKNRAALERLNATTRELIDADNATIADRVAPLVREVLDIEYAALWRYDDRSGDLGEYATDAAGDIDTEAVEFSTDISDRIWETFVGTDVDVENDLNASADATSQVRSRAFVPLGRHGIVCLGSTCPDTFDERTVDLVETVAATVETAWDRTDSERELERRNEELTRLDQLNTLIREIDQALVTADTREEIDEAVCERLADSDFYEFAWIGEHDPATDVVEPRAWAGVDSGYLDALAITVEGTPVSRDPIARAVRTGDLQVAADIATDGDFAPWREATLERGARSVVCIPLVYDEATYGVLTVYADHPQSDEDERNLDVLSELGDTIAHTINARETRATLQTDSVVELTLRFEDADTPMCRLARETESTIVYQGFVPRSDGDTDAFFVARDISPEELRTATTDLLAFENLDSLTGRAIGTLFRARVTADPSLAERIRDGGGVVRSITVDAGVATVVLDVPHTAAVREFLDRLRHWHPELELRGRRARERPLKTRQTFVATLEDQLTARQWETLQTAYLSGYFETPRASTGKEVSELVDVSQPTFSEHLRAAERALCEIVFGNT